MLEISKTRLQDRHVVVVGGGSGIGRAIAEQAIRQQAKVTLASRDEAKLNKVAQEIGGAVDVRPIDMTNEAVVRSWASELEAVDHLVISASSAAHGTFSELPTDDLRKMLEAKFIGPYVVAREVLPVIKQGGSITFFSGALSRKPVTGATGLASVNGAVEVLTKGLAQELAGQVRVNCISPGMTASEAYAAVPAADREAMYAQVGGSLPVGRVGRTDEIAQAALLLITNDFMTGTVLDIDGGYLVRA